MVLGSDVGLEETCRLALCGLVGRLSYSYLANSPMSDWITKNWVPVLGYAPELLCLTKGWMGFICKSLEDADILLKKLWVIGGSNLMLKRWRVAFDPRTETLPVRHLWVLLSGLPLHLWNEGALRAIGDALGHFITLDHSTLENYVRKVGRILVEIDLHGGLLEAIDIEWRGRFLNQAAGLCGYPFRCSWCRGTGHLHRDCSGKSLKRSGRSSTTGGPTRLCFKEDSFGCDPIYYGPEPVHSLKSRLLSQVN
jgi:hypothetical protein